MNKTVIKKISADQCTIKLPLRRGNMDYLFWVEDQDSISEKTVRCVHSFHGALEYEYEMISPYKFNDVEFLQFEV